MALIKAIQTKAGITVSYWKITDWKISQSAKSVDIILTPYISSQTRENGCDPVRDEVRKIRATDFQRDESSFNRTCYTDYFSPEALDKYASEGKSIYQVMYDYIKVHDVDFSDAENG